MYNINDNLTSNRIMKMTRKCCISLSHISIDKNSTSTTRTVVVRPELHTYVTKSTSLSSSAAVATYIVICLQL